MVADFAKLVALECIYVLVSDIELLGYVVLYPKGDALHLENIAVHPKHAGKGLGRQLLDFAEQQARNNGSRAIELYTNEKMCENLSLYPELGYVETGRRVEDGFHRVFFRKRIAPL